MPYVDQTPEQQPLFFESVEFMTVTAFQQANQLLREGKLEAAVIVYRQAIEQNPQFYGAYQNLGETLGKLGRLDESVQVYRKAIELKPAAGWLHQELELLLEKLKTLAENEAIVRVWKPERFLNPTEFLSAKGISTKIQTSISKIVILTCVWKRPELTKVVLSYYEHLKRELAGKINLELLAVGSERDISRNLCQELGFDYLEYPNEPLSGKWEYGLNRCSDYDPDAVIIVGSDDIISQNLIEFYAGQIQEGLVFCGLKDGYFLDMMNQKLYWWVGYGDKVDYKRVGETIGMGRCLSRTLLDKLGFSIWKGLDINRSLDRAMTARLRELGLQFSEYYNCVIAQVEGKIIRIGHCGFRMADIGACAIDIKFSDNITPVERYFERDANALVEQAEPWIVLEKCFPNETVKQIKELVLLNGGTQIYEKDFKESAQKMIIEKPYNLSNSLTIYETLSEKVVLNNLQQANKILSKVIYDSIIDLNHLSTLNFNYCELLLKQSNYEESLKYLQAIPEEKYDYLCYYYLGECLSQCGKWKEAVDAYQESNRLNPKFVNGYARCGDIFMRLEQWDNAKSQFHRAVCTLLE